MILKPSMIVLKGNEEWLVMGYNPCHAGYVVVCHKESPLVETCAIESDVFTEKKEPLTGYVMLQANEEGDIIALYCKRDGIMPCLVAKIDLQEKNVKYGDGLE